MEYISFDLETTGTDPKEARIVTFAVLRMKNGAILGENIGIVNPGVEIPEGAAAVHGVTTEQAVAEGMEPEFALPMILSSLIEPRLPVVIFNARYDITLLYHELLRHKIPGASLLRRLTIIDPLVIDKAVDKYRKGSRKLFDVAAHYGVVLENAHAADADALAAGLVAEELIRRNKFEDLQALHTTQVAWAFEQAVSLQAYFRRSNPEAVVESAWPLVD